MQVCPTGFSVAGYLIFPNSEHSDEIPLKIAAALKQRQSDGKRYRHRRDNFARSIGLLPKTKGQKLAGIETVLLPSLEEEYPPAGYDICETGAIQNIWKQHHKETPYPDRRGGRTWKEFHQLDPTKLNYTVKKNESVIIRDSTSKEIVCVVIRDFCGKPKLLEWVNGVIMENSEGRKSVRVCAFLKLSTRS